MGIPCKVRLPKRPSLGRLGPVAFGVAIVLVSACETSESGDSGGAAGQDRVLGLYENCTGSDQCREPDDDSTNAPFCLLEGESPTYGRICSERCVETATDSSLPDVSLGDCVTWADDWADCGAGCCYVKKIDTNVDGEPYVIGVCLPGPEGGAAGSGGSGGSGGAGGSGGSGGGTLTVSQAVVGGWWGSENCNVNGGLHSFEFGYLICPGGRVSGYSNIDGYDFRECGTWTTDGDVLNMVVKSTAVIDPSNIETVTRQFRYFSGSNTIQAGCEENKNVVLQRLEGDVDSAADCTSGSCGTAPAASCGTDCDCGRCWYCESGTCRYGGEGPYGCYRGCQ